MELGVSVSPGFPKDKRESENTDSGEKVELKGSPKEMYWCLEKKRTLI